MSATNAASGSASSQAGQANTTVENNQVGAGTASGGSGALNVANKHTTNVSDSSAANSTSGVSVALVPTPTSDGKTPGGVTTANSGSASATGLAASNNVHNTTLAAVSVAGASQAPVNETSNSNLSVQDTGASSASSGAAWAVAPDAAGAPSNVATPVTGTAASSTPQNATGLQANNSISQAASATVTTTGSPGNTAPITIAPTQAVSVVSGGVASAQSAAASSTGKGSGSTQAASGAATAQGLVAQNTVNTNANVQVKVAGQNFAPIQVIVNSVTKILNWGVGSASSGDATAAGGGQSTSSNGSTATSGAAQATGAQVQNVVDLHSSAAVKVQGDNHNPINIVLNLAANLLNWGVAVANSGDAQASGNGGSAGSGSANASGLLALNLVNMWADASVDVEGNNYAPITVDITFNTNVDNLGYAAARSGNVAAGSSTSVAAKSESAPVANGRSRARGGNATATGNASTASVVSSQVSSANGSKAIDATALGTMLRNLPAGDWNQMVNETVHPLAPPAVISGVDAHSGDAQSIGLRSDFRDTNSQIAACSDPSGCSATNRETHFVAVTDSPTNAAGGPPGTSAVAQFAGVNATPTPIPSRTETRTSVSSGSHSSSAPRHTEVQFSSNTLDVATTDGRMVMVNLWDQWPGRRMPPMPNLDNTAPVLKTVGASLDAWPGATELPLPTHQDAPSRHATTTRALARTATSFVDSAAEADPQELPLLEARQFDIYAWPAAGLLPLPQQTPPVATAVAPESTSTNTSEPTAEPATTPMDIWAEAAVAAMLIAVGVLATARYLRRRHLKNHQEV